MNCEKQIRELRPFYFRILLCICLLLKNTYPVNAQPEFSTGYAVNRLYADGAPIQLAYDLKIKNRLYTKPQVGFKYLYHFNDFVGAKIKTWIWEFHQTVSYELIRRKKFIFKPNLGVNVRYYTWDGKMVDPLNTLPQRAYVIGFRHSHIVLNSYGEDYKKRFHVFNPGFSIQLQAQFRINEKMWLHLTPFLEPDYDRVQNTAGCYIGLILKQKSTKLKSMK